MMKRLAIILLVFIIMGIAIPSFTAIAQPTKIPHENPAISTGSLDKISLLINYSRIFLNASSKQYTEGLEAIEEIRKIDIPDEFRSIIDHYNRLAQQLFTILDRLDITLSKTVELIEKDDFDEAKIYLDKAEIDVQDAEIILNDINLTTDSLSQRFGVFSPSVSADLQEAYSRLEESMEELQHLSNILTNTRETLNEQYTEIRGLLPTILTLNISQISAHIGDTVNVSGTLQYCDEVLAGKSVSIKLEENTIRTAITKGDGSYSENITLPYEYKYTTHVVAVYEPQDSDIDTYLNSRSPEMIIHTEFYPTLLQLTLPSTIYPGIPFNISGQVNSEINNIERNMVISIDNNQICETSVSGQFNLVLSPPNDISPGQVDLTVTILPKERYAGISKLRNITVSLLPLEIDIQTPGVIFLPKSIQFTGMIQSQLGPISDTDIKLVFSDISATTRTASDGSFKATMDVPLDFSFMGQRELIIRVIPLESSAEYPPIQRQIFFINPVFSGLTLVAALALLIFILRQRRRVDEREISQGEASVSPTFITPQVSTVKITGIKGRIILSFRAVLKAIERITGVRMTPDSTLREFLAKITKILPGITRQFTELTEITESALYFNQKPPRERADTAEQITEDIKREWKRGN